MTIDFSCIASWWMIALLLCHSVLAQQQQQQQQEDIPNDNYIFRGKINYGSRGFLTPIKPAKSFIEHTITFAIQLLNLNRLEEALYEVSNPFHPKYGQHWTRQQIAELTANVEGTRIVEQYLQQKGIQIIKKTPYGEYITAKTTIQQWEHLFNTHFYEYQHRDWKNQVIYRAKEYSLPHELHAWIADVFNVIDFPAKTLMNQPHHYQTTFSATEESLHLVNNSKFTTPSRLIAHYHIDTKLGNNATTQAALSCLEESVSPKDISLFQTYFNLTQQSLVNNVGGHISNTACYDSIGNCLEASLDYEYLMAIGQNIPTSDLYLDNDCSFVTVAQKFLALSNPPKVISISYGINEGDLGLSGVNAFSNAAMVLGLMGVTVLAASGDDGAAGYTVDGDASNCAYNPQFPASSPYVTAVGATEFVRNRTEVVCQSDNGGGITSGGGFSIYSTVPTWQVSAVNGYFRKAAQNSKTPVAGYLSSGRAYPDLSALGVDYPTVTNGTFSVVSGTSASCPVVAGMVSLVNAVRASAGNPTLGFLNPFLYSQYSSFVWDITSGDNLCTKTICCQQGFYAMPGWDPVTGLGVLNFTAFKIAATNLQLSFEPTISPSAVPTVSPTTAAPTTKRPTFSPTFFPPIFQLAASQYIYDVNWTAVEQGTMINEETLIQAILACVTVEIAVNVTDINFYYLVNVTESNAAPAISEETISSSSTSSIFPNLRSLRALPLRTTDQTSSNEINLSNITAYLNYTLSVQARSLTYLDYKEKLSFAVQEQIFTNQLQDLAIQNSANGLLNAFANNITVTLIVAPVAPSFSPTSAPTNKNSQIYETYLTPIVLGGVFIIVLIVVSMYLRIVYRRHQKNRQLSKVHVYQE